MKLKFVDKVGVELEGGWNRLFLPDTHIIWDQSVGSQPGGAGPDPVPNLSGRKCECGDACPPDRTCHWGEIPSPPLGLEEVLEWTKVHWPDGINHTCGFHVHLSFKSDVLYAMLMSKDFDETFAEKAETWGKLQGFKEDHQFWLRLRSKYDPHAPDAKTTPARFCNRPWDPFRQIKMTEKHDERRTRLNYCYRQHKTIECRLFPAFPDAKTALSAIILYATTADGWLEEHVRRERKRTVIVRA